MKTKVCTSLVAFALLGSCALQPPMVTYSVVSVPEQETALPEEDLGSEVADISPVTEETADQTLTLEEADAAREAEEDAINTEETRRVLAQAQTPGNLTTIFFHMPRSLLLLDMEEQNKNSSGMGSGTAPRLVARSVPTEAPIRRRVYDAPEFIEEEETSEDGEVEALDSDDTPVEGVQGTSSGDPDQELAEVREELENGEEEAQEGEEGEEEVAEIARPFHYEEEQPLLYAMRRTVGGEDLKISYFENSRLISAVGRNTPTITPNNAAPSSTNLIALANSSPIYFSSLGGENGGALGGASPLYPDVVPTAIDVDFYLAEVPDAGMWQPLPFNPGWSYRIDVSAPPADSIDRKSFFKEIQNRPVGFLPVSACRDATLYIVREEPEALVEKEDIAVDFSDYVQEQSLHQFKLKVADPNRVQIVAFPIEGQVAMHSSCGADLSGTNARSQDDRLMVSARAEKARALLDTWQKVLRQ